MSGMGPWAQAAAAAAASAESESGRAGRRASTRAWCWRASVPWTSGVTLSRCAPPPAACLPFGIDCCRLVVGGPASPLHCLVPRMYCQKRTLLHLPALQHVHRLRHCRETDQPPFLQAVSLSPLNPSPSKS